MRYRNLFCFVAFLLLMACEKNGELRTIEEYAQLTVRIEYVEAADDVFRIDIQDQVFAEGLTFADPEKRAVNNKKYMITQEKKHLVVYNTTQQRVELDTALDLQKVDAVTLIQLPGERFSILSAASGGDEPEPVVRSATKARFVYSDPLLPDSISIKIYSGPDPYSPWDWSVDPPTHLFDLRAELNTYRGKLTPYLELDYKQYGQDVASPATFVMEIYDLKEGTPIQTIQLIDYWYTPGIMTNGLSPAPAFGGVDPIHKFTTSRIKGIPAGGLSIPDMLDYQPELLYGIPY